MQQNPSARAKPKSALPRWLQLELQRTARAGAVEEAMRWTEQLFDARERGDVAGVYRAAVRAKQAAPRSPTVREALGLAAFERGSWHEAAQELLAHRRFAGGHAHDPMIADAYRRLGKIERALEIAVAVPRDAGDRTWASAQIVRAQCLADRGNHDPALDLLTAARATVSSRVRLAIDAAIGRLQTER